MNRHKRTIMNGFSKNFIRATIAGATLGCGAVKAQPLDYNALQALFDEPVTTSVTGTPQRASQVPATMVIITAEQIRRSGAIDLPGVLRHVVGVDAWQWTADHADVAVRGYNQSFSPRLLVLVDGRQVYADHYGYTPWNTIAVEIDAIQQVEIVKGPAAALFGFNAVAGVINIITRNPLYEDMATISAIAGTQSRAGVSAVTSWRWSDNAALRVTAGSRRSEDFTTPHEEFDQGARRGNHRDALTLDGRFRLAERVQFGVEATWSDAALTDVPPTYLTGFTEYQTRSLATSWSAETRAGVVEARLYRNEIDARPFLGEEADAFFDFQNRVTVAQLRHMFKVGPRHTLRFAAEHRENGMDTTPVAGGRVFYDISSLAATWHWAFTPTLTLTNAVREDQWDLGRQGFLPDQYEEFYGWTNETWNRSYRRTSYNTGMVWEARRAGTFRFLTGRGPQLPNLVNLGASMYEIFEFWIAGVPIIKPATVTSHEISWSRPMGSSNVTLRGSLYHNETRNVMSAFMNIGTSRSNGIELSAEGSVGMHWRWSAGYVQQRITDRFDDEFGFEWTYIDFENTTPRHIIKGSLGWSSTRWDVNAFLRHQSTAQSVRGTHPVLFVPTLEPVQAHVAADMRVAYTPSSRYSIALSGRNVARSSQRQTSAADVQPQLQLRFSYNLRTHSP
jgi:outer membrane receptor for ferrienterochelin and colicins